MAKATKPINTPSRDGKTIILSVAAAAKIFAGTIVAVNADGYAVAASDAAGLKVVGRANCDCDNSDGAAGAKEIEVERGVFRFSNSSTAAVTRAEWNTRVFVEDDNTVAKTSTNSVCAGVMVGLDDEGVWVDTAQSALPAEAAAK